MYTYYMPIGTAATDTSGQKNFIYMCIYMNRIYQSIAFAVRYDLSVHENILFPNSSCYRLWSEIVCV